MARLKREISRIDELRGEEDPINVDDASAVIDESVPARELLYEDLEPSKFRLLHLEQGRHGDRVFGQMQSYSLDAPLDYFALSYVWGDEQPIEKIFVNNALNQVKPNLYYALKEIRLPYIRHNLWIDTLCINQKSYEERKKQISQMSTIYGNATGVVIWLGEIAEASTRMANGIVSKQSLEILASRSRSLHSDPQDINESIRRTLYADSDTQGRYAPFSYHDAMQYLLSRLPEYHDYQGGYSPQISEDMHDIDPEELLVTELPRHVDEYLRFVRDLVWDRKTFRITKCTGKTLVGTS